MTEHTNQIEGKAAENAEQIERQELLSFRQTLRSIEWLLPLMVVLYLFVADIFIADKFPCRSALVSMPSSWVSCSLSAGRIKTFGQ